MKDYIAVMLLSGSNGWWKVTIAAESESEARSTAEALARYLPHVEFGWIES